MEKEEILNLEDGSELKPELEKEKEKDLKEVEKDLKDKADLVDDINEAEAEVFTEDLEKLTEKLTLDEAPIPGDLVKAYKRSSYKGAEDADLHNATYEEITPEEAKSLVKSGNANVLRLIVNGRTILLRDTGYGSLDDRFRTDISWNKAYHTRSGAEVRDTARLPVAYLLSVADKIYKTNEAEPEGQKDSALLAARSDSKPKELSSSIATIGGRGSNGPSWSLKWDIEMLREAEQEYKQKKDDILRRLRNGEISQDQADKAISDLKLDLENKRISYGSSINRKKDFEARKRYGNSEVQLTAPLRKLKRLKGQVKLSKTNLNTTKNNLSKIYSSGSSESRRLKSEISELERTINWHVKRLMSLEQELDKAELDSPAEILELQDKVDNLQQEINDNQLEIDKLLRRTEGFENAKGLLDLVESKNLKEDLYDIIDTMYPRYSNDDILKCLDLDHMIIKEMLDLED